MLYSPLQYLSKPDQPHSARNTWNYQVQRLIYHTVTTLSTFVLSYFAKSLLCRGSAWTTCTSSLRGVHSYQPAIAHCATGKEPMRWYVNTFSTGSTLTSSQEQSVPKNTRVLFFSELPSPAAAQEGLEQLSLLSTTPISSRSRAVPQ